MSVKKIKNNSDKKELENIGSEVNDVSFLYGEKASKLKEYNVAASNKTLNSASFDWNDDTRGYDLVHIIREGINYKSFSRLTKSAPLNDKDWAKVLDTTTRTLERYKKDNKILSSTQTEKVIEIQQLMNYGEEVFGEVPNFHKWLLLKNVGMGGIIPKDLLDTSVGLSIVKDTLGRIEHGILA